MASEPLPDHYKALGVDKSADATTIKTVYRKLVLKCHPDKVIDPQLKQQKQEEFHQIQEAYEVLVDDEKRADYESRLRLEELRREKPARGATQDKSARFEVRTGGSRYSTEERKPSRAYDEDDRYYEERSRSKYDTYAAYPKGTAPRSGRTEKESPSKTRPNADRTRSDRAKTRDRELRSERKVRGNESDSSSDDARHAKEYKRRSHDDEIRKPRKEDRRSYEEPRYNIQRKMSAQEEEAKRYQQRSGTLEPEPRNSPPRKESRDYFSPPRKESRPEAPRRSSARPKERSSGRLVPEIVEWSERRPPAFTHSSSSPANIQIPRVQRSQTDAAREYRERDRSPPAAPSFQRSATMSSVPNISSRRKESVQRPSGLREASTPASVKVEQEEFPFVAQPQSTTKYYHYPTPGGGVPLRQEDIIGAGNHRTILREPERQRHRSPSPFTRPPMGANRPSEAAVPQFKTSAPPPLSRSSTARHVSPMRTEERGRSSRPSLYGEIPTEGRGRQSSYGPASVQYSRRYGHEDVRWAPRGRDNERDYVKPSLGRSATTMAY